MTKQTAVYLTASNGEKVHQMYLLPKVSDMAVLGRAVSPDNPKKRWLFKEHSDTRPLWQFIVQWSKNIEDSDWVAPFRPQFIELTDKDISDLNDRQPPYGLIRRTNIDGWLDEQDMPSLHPDAHSMHVFEPLVDNVNEGARLITWLIENDLYEA